MKRVKVMLTAIAIMAVVGGALAFKAKTYSGTFCIRTTTLGPGVCTTSYVGKLANAVDPGRIYYTTPTANLANCAIAQCPTSTSVTVAEGGN